MRHFISTMAIALIFAVAAQPAAAADRPSYNQLRQQVTVLKKSRATWKRRADRNAAQLPAVIAERNTARSERDAARGQVTTLQGQVSALGGQVNTLQGANATLATQNASLTTERDQALSGLSGEVTAFVSAATSASQIYNTILAPARVAWKCGGSTFLGDTFISVDFNRIGFCV